MTIHELINELLEVARIYGDHCDVFLGDFPARAIHAVEPEGPTVWHAKRRVMLVATPDLTIPARAAEDAEIAKELAHEQG